MFQKSCPTQNHTRKAVTNSSHPQAYRHLDTFPNLKEFFFNGLPNFVAQSPQLFSDGIG